MCAHGVLYAHTAVAVSATDVATRELADRNIRPVIGRWRCRRGLLSLIERTLSCELSRRYTSEPRSGRWAPFGNPKGNTPMSKYPSRYHEQMAEDLEQLLLHPEYRKAYRTIMREVRKEAKAVASIEDDIEVMFALDNAADFLICFTEQQLAEVGLSYDWDGHPIAQAAQVEFFAIYEKNRRRVLATV